MRAVSIVLALLVAAPAVAGAAPSMASRPGRVKGVVVAAPHDGYDLDTGTIARTIASDLYGLVIASGYRRPRAGRFVNVNRPTEVPVVAGRRQGGERRTRRAEKVFLAYRAHLLDASGRGRLPLELLVSVHGNSRRVLVTGRLLLLEVVEVATTGFDAGQLRELAHFAAERTQRAGIALRFVFDRLAGQGYSYRGRMVRFHFRATGTRKLGSMHPAVSRRALHFELPRSARARRARHAVARVIAAIVARAIEWIRR